MPLRTQLDSPHCSGETWDRVFDHRNPQRTTTSVNPELVVNHTSLRFMVQLYLAGQRLRGFLHLVSGGEMTGRCTNGSWFTVGLEPDADALFPVAQGGPQRLWDTVESCHTVWRRLGEPNVARFGVTVDHNPSQQHVWFDHSESHYRWPLPL